MKKLNKNLLKLVERAVRNEVTKNSYNWPPHCNGLFHQPMRPQKKGNEKRN